MKNFFRGSNVHIGVTFYDSDGGVITPTGAKATISYVPLNSETSDRTFITYDLVQATTIWSYDWDSSIAEPGAVYVHAATNDTPTSTVDFEFRLTANRANKELFGDDCAPVSG